MALALGAVIGIIGDGQLGRMLSQAASKLGFKVSIFGPNKNSPAANVSAYNVVADYSDLDALLRFAKACDVVTFEFENVPASSIDYLLESGIRVAPSAFALRQTQDRVVEKQFAKSVGVKTTDFAEVNCQDSLKKAINLIGLPALLKTRREGYDGKGQVWIKTADEAAEAYQQLGLRSCILEAKADFTREISVIAARGWDGEIKTYPLGENHHINGILSTTIAPCDVSETMIAQAHNIASLVLEGLSYVGVLGVELFVMKDGSLWLNEIAPRVHNSGHWTQSGCLCDQFEQHIRAVAGWPLGDTRAHAKVEMTNLLGDEILDFAALSAQTHAQLFVYGKDTPKMGRKMGHINRVVG